MIKILLSISLCFLFSISVYAQQDTPISEVKASEIELLNEQDEQRNQEIANQLGFVLPKYTDNPSYIITFKDPSPNESGVEIDLDEKGFNKIESPYTFPALSIGFHDVRFRFTDSENSVKILEYELIVIPRAPIVDTPEISISSVSVSGSALANSDVLYILSGNAYHTTGTVQTDSQGKWSVTIESEQEFIPGIYTFTALARKYGYSSTLSTPLTFNIGESSTQKTEEIKQSGISFSFKSINKDNILNIFKENRDLLFLILGSIVLGLGIGAFIKTVLTNSKSEKKNKEVEGLIKKSDSKDANKTLREIFGDDTTSKEETVETKEEVKEESEKEPEKQESIINKDVFLKKYKMVDPDDDKGVEKKKKKKIKVSLTSKD
ncbi:hypothetical protein GX618_03590 [Candidatus Dojkabacteria bacterium]|uniref:Bacterial Ig-like domain-containing protein n=1 Tax=Candidatus Dojkabacteria bacterium TaxID=2099670 RepID=A0A847EUB5_9BACT|nr:hypothetical protein [Candidatus Dojkabacteria bacterium]